MSTKQKLPARRLPARADGAGQATPVYRIGASGTDADRIDLQISPRARADMEQNKRHLALSNDRELLRHALSLQKWAVDLIRGGKRVFVTDAEGRVEAEMRVEPVRRPGQGQEVILEMVPRRPR
jgi:hypothetical protein